MMTIAMMKKLMEAIKKFIISVSPNNLPLPSCKKAVWERITPYRIWINPNRINKNPIPAEINAIQFNVFIKVFIGSIFVYASEY